MSFDGDQTLPDYSFTQLFPVKITDKVKTSGTWFYTWTEQTFSASTGAFSNADTPRTGTKTSGPFLVEMNNAEAQTLPWYTWARFRGLVGGDLYYEFALGGSPLTVELDDGSSAVSGVSTLQFDKNVFSVTNPSTGTADVHAASSMTVNDLTVNGNITIVGTSLHGGTETFNGNVILNNPVTVNNNITFFNAATFNSTTTFNATATFTGGLKSCQTSWTPSNTPAAIGADKTDYNPGSLCVVERLQTTGTSSWKINSLDDGTSGAARDGRVYVFENILDGAGTGECLIFPHGTVSVPGTATNQWITPGKTQLCLTETESNIAVYDNTTGRWRVVGTTAIFKGSGALHGPGLVPDPGATQTGCNVRYLSENGWAAPFAGGFTGTVSQTFVTGVSFDSTTCAFSVTTKTLSITAACGVVTNMTIT